jgi:hypothetical protein
MQTEAMTAAQQYVGKPLAELVDACKTAGWTVRVTRRDGRSLIGTCDFRPDRINVSADGDVVTAIGGIG